MPELPEVEVLVRHLDPLLKGKTIRSVTVHRERVIRPDTVAKLKRSLVGARFVRVERRAKFLVFTLAAAAGGNPHAGRRRGALPLTAGSRQHVSLLGHLGMTGRMYLQPARAPLPRHAAISMDLGRVRFVYEDTRFFGRLTTELSSLESLGPEPLGEFPLEPFIHALQRSAQPIKVKLLGQTVVAGIGNIYASEALFRARLSPRKPARRLRGEQIGRLRLAIREVLREAIACGSTLPLDFQHDRTGQGLFYYGLRDGESAFHRERLLVYDRESQPCIRCGTPIRRIVQAARSTFFCPHCQRS